MQVTAVIKGPDHVDQFFGSSCFDDHCRDSGLVVKIFRAFDQQHSEGFASSADVVGTAS